MKTSIENVAKFIAAAILADGKYEEAEQIALAEVADALGVEAQAFQLKVEDAINELPSIKNLKEYLCIASTEVAEGENNIIFEALLEIVLVDGVLSASEVETLLDEADLLAISQADAVLMLADMIKEEPETKIEF